MNNPAKQKLAAGGTVVALSVNLPSAALVEMLALLGPDLLVVDTEHTTISLETFEGMVRAADVAGVPLIARLGENEPQRTLRFLDAGADGVQITMVSTREDAERAVASVKYPPLGSRGLAPTRAAHYGLRGPLTEYVEIANRETLVVVQIETPEGVENAAAIAAVPGVDVVMVGPTDLASTMGHLGQPRHPDVLAATDHVATAVLQAGKAVGNLARNLADCQALREQGYRYLYVGTTGLLTGAVTTLLAELRRPRL
jgi:4-hydroxy-2-oxoheptanedioate aldolase